MAVPAFPTSLLAIAVGLLAATGLAASCGGGDSAPGGDEPDKRGAADLGDIRFDASGWRTDFAKHSVPLTQFTGGGPPKDGIPAIDNPKFISVTEADRHLRPKDPLTVVASGNQARAYPLEIMIWHEIVNDTFAGLPVAVTYCPLCNSALVFDRRVDGRVLDFGTTGNLRRSNLLMYDRQTESWWQQIGGQALVGKFTGKRLTQLPAQTLAWREFTERYPDGDVLSRDTGHSRP